MYEGFALHSPMVAHFAHFVLMSVQSFPAILKQSQIGKYFGPSPGGKNNWENLGKNKGKVGLFYILKGKNIVNLMVSISMF